MPRELIYTSAPRGLAFGQSGFCTVARTADLREALIPRLEQISAYHYLNSGTSVNPPRRNPTIYAYRILDLRGTRFHVLSRILPCGVDFTARTNHLAHHLIFGVEELVGAPSPAAILRDWDGWRSAWQGEPRLLDPLPAGSFSRLPPPVWPAETWRQVTGDAGRAAGLLEADFCRGSYLLAPPGGEHLLLNLFCETQQLLNPTGKFQARAWQHTFTTFLQGEDGANDFNWRGCQEGTPAYEQAQRRAATMIPVQAVRAPNNPLAKLAREGPKLPPTPSPALAVPGSRPPLSIHRPPMQSPSRRPVYADLTRGERDVGPDNDYSGWNISINVKSLLGIGIAVVILAGLLVAKRHLWGSNHLLASKLPPAPLTDHSNGDLPAPRPERKPAAAPEPPATNKPVPPSFEGVEPSPQLGEVLPGIPTYLFVVPTLTNDNLSMAGIPPLVKLLQQFGRIDLTPTALDMRFALMSWGASPKFVLSGDPNPNKRQLRLQSAVESQPKDEFTFDYSSLPEQAGGQETIRLQTRFEPQQLASLSAFSLTFQAASLNGLIRGVAFAPFGLLVINGGKPPSPIKLNKHLLRADQGTLELTLGKPLWERLKQLHIGALAWQLHPYIITTNASGANVSEDLYQWLPPELHASLGAGLDFTRVNGVLTKRLREQAAKAGSLQQEIQQKSSISLPLIDQNLPVGAFLGQTNEHLMSFNAFLAQQQAKPSSQHFLKYLVRLAEAAREQQSWMGDWVDTPAESTPQRLQKLFNLWAENLPASAAELTVTNGTTSYNYFVLGWDALRWAEQIDRLMKDKELADKSLEGRQQLVDWMPKNLEQVAYLRLFLEDSKNELEVIRFADFKPR